MFDFARRPDESAEAMVVALLNASRGCHVPMIAIDSPGVHRSSEWADVSPMEAQLDSRRFIEDVWRELAHKTAGCFEKLLGGIEDLKPAVSSFSSIVQGLRGRRDHLLNRAFLQPVRHRACCRSSTVAHKEPPIPKGNSTTPVSRGKDFHGGIER